MPMLTKRRRRLRKKRGGGQDTHTSTTQSIAYPQYGLPAGASSHREAAMLKTSTMHESQQSMIDAHGGRKKRMTSRRRRKSARKNKKRNTKRNTRSLAGKTRRRVKRSHRLRGGDKTGQAVTVTVPSFSNSGSDVSSINANSMSQISNSTNLTANSQASNDCYATGTCLK